MDLNLPQTLDFGFGPVTEVKYLEQVFGISHRTAMKYLKALHIEPFYVGKKAFFSLTTLKRILYVLSLPGSTGFVFPGSSKKNDPRVSKNQALLMEVTPEILEKAAEPSVLAQMAGASGNDPNILRKLLTNPVGRPKEKKEE